MTLITLVQFKVLSFQQEDTSCNVGVLRVAVWQEVLLLQGLMVDTQKVC